MDLEKKLESMISKDIMDIINKIKGCHSKSIYDILVADLFMLYNLANYLGIENIPDVDKYSYKYFNSNNNSAISKKLKKFLDKIDFYELLTNNYIELYEDYNLEDHDLSFYEGSLKVNLNMEDSVDLALEFLEKENIKLYKRALELMKNGRMIYLPSRKLVDEYGLTYVGLTNFDPYIIINNTKTLETSASIVHELGHVYDREISKNNSNKLRINKQYNHTEEMYSHYLELLFYDFLEEKKIFSDDVLKLKQIYDLNMNGSYNNMNCMLDEIINKCIYEFNEMRIIPEYAIGMTIAYHFYDMHLKNKMVAKENVNSFLVYNNLLEVDEILNEFGLDKEEFESTEIVEKYLKKNWK